VVYYNHRNHIQCGNTKEENKMETIKAKNKKDIQAKAKEYRKLGYNIITFEYTMIEMEKGNKMIVITL
jgi:hypothetical protein